MSFFNQNLRYLRTNYLKLSQEKLATKLEIKRGKYAAYEETAEPRYEVLMKLAELFHLDIHNLITVEMNQANMNVFFRNPETETYQIRDENFVALLHEIKIEKDPKEKKVLFESLMQRYRELHQLGDFHKKELKDKEQDLKTIVDTLKEHGVDITF